jgi:carbonic anhydrase
MRIQRLVEGIHHFQSEVFENEQAFFRNLAHEQRPEALFITCADSRINPNLVTQTAPGELFVVRNVGNLVPVYHIAGSAEAAAIEFAVVSLGIKDIIICGHTHCGAMQALLDPAMFEGLPSLRGWLDHAGKTRQIIEQNYGHLDPEAKLRATIKENVLVQLEHLRTHPAVDEGLKGGRLHLHGWVYHLESGEVASFDPELGQFKPIGLSGVEAGEPLLGP